MSLKQPKHQQQQHIMSVKTRPFTRSVVRASKCIRIQSQWRGSLVRKKLHSLILASKQALKVYVRHTLVTRKIEYIGGPHAIFVLVDVGGAEGKQDDVDRVSSITLIQSIWRVDTEYRREMAEIKKMYPN